MNSWIGFWVEWLKGFARYLGKMILYLLILMLAAILFQYLTCPVYQFPDPEPFSGDQIFNPYLGVDSLSWRKANFQVQSRAWGGMTDGRKNTNELIDSIYYALGYDIIATSDYQRINRWGEEKGSYIPVYEHGYGLFKNHQVLVGAKRVTWADFPIYQNIHHKQHILSKLRKDNELVYIAHPGLRGGYKPEDMKYLTGYDGLEVLNYMLVSEAHWDSALSAGRYVTVMGNDDAHDVRNPLEVGHRCTYIYSPSLQSESILNALKHGKAFGADIFRTGDESMEEKAEKAKRIAKLTSVRVTGDTLTVRVNMEARLYRFIGQGGKVKKYSHGGDSASYVFQPDDSYIRTEIVFPTKDVFYLNPVIRFDGTYPADAPRARVDNVRSWIFWIVSWSTFIFILMNAFYFRRIWKRNNWSLHGMLFGNRYRTYLFILISLSLVIKVIMALNLELGNDEVYYWTYALYPDLSHFDHPPMVGWIIQFFTLDLLFQNEFFLRMPGMVLGVFNVLLVYLIGKSLRDAHTGWMAALLYTASVYCFILSGTFILPDTPQQFFWLLTIYLFLEPLKGNPDFQRNKWRLLLAGLAVGLAMLSKYTSLFLWIGAGLFILIYNRRWLKSAYLYLSILISFLVFLPVLIWNFRNDFISFAFHGERTGFFQGGVRLDYFLTEISGEMLYNNPIVFIVVVLALIRIFKGRQLLKERKNDLLILFWSVPLILVFLFMSLFRQTLPHWTGPAYTTLIFLGAGWLVRRQEIKGRRRFLSGIPAWAIALLLVIITAGILQVNHGLFYTGREEDMTRRGRNDVSLDMYGWDQVRGEFSWLVTDDAARGIMPEHAPIVTFRWFPAANLDYYVARRTHRQVLAYGPLQSIHKYAWITKERGGFQEGMDAYYITTSRDYKEPGEVFGDAFREIELAYYFPIRRGGEDAAFGFIYHLRGYKKR